ncbi:response regulator transcription factor [Bosea sp. (in: a-proteobacteria)]|uniref:response regulator transcription factor n=1 Tax=Bosea sp. (in: a-proteobacteria) TaxID=1871050 RepID=UPI00333F284D
MKESRAFGIAILGKYSLMREGISRILQEQKFRVLTSGTSVEELRGKVRTQRLLFLIVHTSDDFSLVAAEIERVRGEYPEAHVAVVAEHYAVAEPGLAFRAGAAGYLVNAISCDAFIKCIELLMLGEAVFPPAFPAPEPVAGKRRRTARGAAVPHQEQGAAACASPESAAAPLLSPRETAILRCLIEGDSNKFIARKIDIAEATVKAHIKAILRKIRVQNRTQAAIWGINNAVLLLPANSNSAFSPAEAETGWTLSR